jgi:hypothetical protein
MEYRILTRAEMHELTLHLAIALDAFWRQLVVFQGSPGRATRLVSMGAVAEPSARSKAISLKEIFGIYSMGFMRGKNRRTR